MNPVAAVEDMITDPSNCYQFTDLSCFRANVYIDSGVCKKIDCCFFFSFIEV